MGTPKFALLWERPSTPIRGMDKKKALNYKHLEQQQEAEEAAAAADAERIAARIDALIIGKGKKKIGGSGSNQGPGKGK